MDKNKYCTSYLMDSGHTDGAVRQEMPLQVARYIGMYGSMPLFATTKQKYIHKQHHVPNDFFIISHVPKVYHQLTPCQGFI